MADDNPKLAGSTGGSVAHFPGSAPSAAALGKLWSGCLGVLGIYVAVLVLTTLFQRQLIFLPSRFDARAAEAEAQARGLRPIRTEGQLTAYELPTTGPVLRQWLILHGNAGHALHRSSQAIALQQASGPGTRVWILEYPGYGARSGSPSQASLGAAAIAAARSMLDQHDVPLLLFAESLGSGVAGELLASPIKPAGVLWLTPFDELAAVAQHHYPWLPVAWLLHDRFAPSRSGANFDGRSAVVIAQDDWIVPKERGDALFQALSGTKTQIRIEGGHNPSFSAETSWFKRTVSWLLSS